MDLDLFVPLVVEQFQLLRLAVDGVITFSALGGCADQVVQEFVYDVRLFGKLVAWSVGVAGAGGHQLSRVMHCRSRPKYCWKLWDRSIEMINLSGFCCLTYLREHTTLVIKTHRKWIHCKLRDMWKLS